MELFIIFVIANVINVVLHTTKSLITVKGTKLQAAAMNAIAFGLYQVILVLSVCELPLWLKIVVVGSANFVGVYFTKTIEEKVEKERLWKVEATISPEHFEMVQDLLKDIPHSYIDIDKYYIFNFYCSNKQQSKKTKEILNAFDAKYFVSESKVL